MSTLNKILILLVALKLREMLLDALQAILILAIIACSNLQFDRSRSTNVARIHFNKRFNLLINWIIHRNILIIKLTKAKACQSD